MVSHNGCEVGCTSTRHEAECRVAHPSGPETLRLQELLHDQHETVDRLAFNLVQVRFSEAMLREALRRIEWHGAENCDCCFASDCVEACRVIAEEALR